MEPEAPAPACMWAEAPGPQFMKEVPAEAPASAEAQELELAGGRDDVLQILAPCAEAEASASAGEEGYTPEQLLKIQAEPSSPSAAAAGDRIETHSDCSTADSTEASPHRPAAHHSAAGAAPPRTPLNPQVAAFVPGAAAHRVQAPTGSSFAELAGAAALVPGQPGGGQGELPWYEVLLRDYLGTSVLPTIGSKDHMLGICKPCAFVHREEGCKSGVQCKFCHLCEPGVRKQRKKAKQQTARALRQQWGYQLPLL